MDMSKLIGQNPPWLLNTGPGTDIIISSRIRIARNLDNFFFVSKNTPEQKIQIEQHITSNVLSLPKFENAIYCPLKTASMHETFFLFERHLISKELAMANGVRSVIFTPDEIISLMIHEEDHLRLQCFGSGLCLKDIYIMLAVIDRVLEAKLGYAFHPKFGYLTACPSNAGTGLRVSVMLHLPGLALTQQIDKIIKEIGKHHLQLRGFLGEGTDPISDFYQLYNQRSFGMREEDLIDIATNIVPQIVECERQVRERMLENNYSAINKLVQNAYQTVTTQEEMKLEIIMNYFSILRLGIYFGLIPIKIDILNRIFLLSQVAHLQTIVGGKVEVVNWDKARMIIIKKLLSNTYD